MKDKRALLPVVLFPFTPKLLLPPTLAILWTRLLKNASKKPKKRTQNTEHGSVLAFGKIVAIRGKNNYHSIMVAFNEIENVARRIGDKTNAKAVVLFGSHARNEAQENSDVDLLVIAESNLPRHKRSRQLHLMFKPYPFAMDILVYTPKEVEAESQFELSFISRVLREGKRLYGQTV
jgi:predicted nucleotidyltransferase